MKDKPRDNQANTEPTEPPRKPGLLNAVSSALAAIFGIQSDKNRQRDFKSADPYTLIMVGVAVVIGIVIAFAAVVNSILSATGAQ